MTKALTALFFLFASISASASAADRVKVQVATDPPIVAPGGWVDVVFHYEIDAGWHAVSPRSKNGTPVQSAFELTEGLRTSGGLWAAPGKQIKDATFGEIEQLAGKGELRQRLFVAEDAHEGKSKLKGQTSWILCNATSCMPPQRLDFELELAISPSGVRGPRLQNVDPQFPLSASEYTLLLQNGFVVHPRIETDRARGGDDVFVVLDFVIAEGYAENGVQILCEPQEKHFLPLTGWRAFSGSLMLKEGATTKAFREVLPLRFFVGGEAGHVTIPVDVTVSTVKVGVGSSSLATQSLSLEIDYKP
jgi:hypothetical protein